MLGVAVQPSQTASQTDEVGSLMLCDTEIEPSEFNQLLSKNHDIYSFNMLVVRMQVWLDRVDQRPPVLVRNSGDARRTRRTRRFFGIEALGQKFLLRFSSRDVANCHEFQHRSK